MSSYTMAEKKEVILEEVITGTGTGAELLDIIAEKGENQLARAKKTIISASPEDTDKWFKVMSDNLDMTKPEDEEEFQVMDLMVQFGELKGHKICNTPGKYNVGLLNTKTGAGTETQGDLLKDQEWGDFFEWLVGDIYEWNGSYKDVQIEYIEFAGDLEKEGENE